MSLSNKINLILISTLVIVLTTAFWIITDIEGRNIRNQIYNSTGTVMEIMREEIERMFYQIRHQQDSLQTIVEKMSMIAGVEYVQVVNSDGFYVAATQYDLIGKKVAEGDMIIIQKVMESKGSIDNIKETKEYYELERYIPISLYISDGNLEVVNIIEAEIKTPTKSKEDLRQAEKLLQMISASVEESVRELISTTDEDLASLQKITDSAIKLGFFHDIFVFDSNLNVIAATSGDSKEPESDPEEFKKLRREIIEGKTQPLDYRRVHENQEVSVRSIPIYLVKNDGAKVAGLIEMHILSNIFMESVNAMRARMAVIIVILIIILTVILVWLLRREVILPIKRYSLIAQKVASGDLNQRIEKTSKDEIGKFGEVFNLMVSNLRELDKLKSEFISVAAHQLRTPLSAVKWAVKMVLDGDAGPVNEEQKNILDQGYKSNERMIALINDLLDVSRIEAGRFEYEFVEISLEDLIETSIQEFQQIAKHKSINLKYYKSERRLPKVKADSLKLKMVVENLIDNAIKYTAPGGQVEVLFKYYRNTIEVIVSDSGVGIPKDQISQLFSKFFRAKNVIRMQTDGTGLGLFIAKRIVEKHGGIIWAESEEGKGTQMHFTLPTA